MSIESIIDKAEIKVIAAYDWDVDAYDDLKECMTRDEIGALLKKAHCNVWNWCCVQVKIEFDGLEFSEYLGACSYANEVDFINNSGYHDDMVEKVKGDLRQYLTSLKNELNNEEGK